MNALRRQNIRPQQTFERWTPRTQESPHELARQSEAKRKQAPQSEANVCRRWRKCNLKKTSLINWTGHPTQIRGCVHGTRMQKWQIPLCILYGYATDFLYMCYFPWICKVIHLRLSLPLLKLIIVCARRYSHRRISLSKDVGRDLWGVHQQLQSDSGTYMY